MVDNMTARTSVNVTEIDLSMGDGTVKFICGPPEYHAEMSVILLKSGGAQRFDLTRMLAIDKVRDWFAENQGNQIGSDRLESEVLKLIALLSSLECVEEFGDLFTGDVR